MLQHKLRLIIPSWKQTCTHIDSFFEADHFVDNKGMNLASSYMRHYPLGAILFGSSTVSLGWGEIEVVDLCLRSTGSYGRMSRSGSGRSLQPLGMEARWG